MIYYDFPLLEKTRTQLRLEHLFERIHYYTAGVSPLDHHSALTALFDVMDLTTRPDLKLELSAELERQRQKLAAYSDNPEVDSALLQDTMAQHQQICSELLNMPSKPGQDLRDNEWLCSIRGRAALPGGVCEFDLPSYHYWLSQEPQLRRADIERWTAPLAPLQRALAQVLKILRTSGSPLSKVAAQGSFQLMMGGRSYSQLVRIGVAHPHCVPEISANKYALNIRFVTPNINERAQRLEADVAFELTFCDL